MRTLKSFFIFFFILFNARTNCQTWTQQTNVGGSVRNAGSGFSIGNYGYIGMGYSGSGLLQDFWKYDPVANTWTQVANFGGAGRFGALSFSIGSKGYVGLGSSGYPVYNFVTDFYEYDPVANVWTQLNNFPGLGRYTVASFVIGNKGYMGTGWSPYYNDFWEYNPATDTWLQKANFPGGPRQSAVGFSIGNTGYMGTGNAGSNSFANFYSYDPATNIWTPIANFPGAARYGSISFTIGSTGYVGTGGSTISNYCDFYSYNKGTNTWSPVISYPGPGISHAVGFAIGNCGFFGTGVSGSGIKNTFWSLCPEVLPIELLNFDAFRKDDYVLLDWSTASEINNNFFTVERSIDGLKFTPIGIINGAGNSTTYRGYSILDDHPLKGISYYRLRQTDYDGSFMYSDIRIVNFEYNYKGITLYPNPTQGEINLAFSSAIPGVDLIRIEDLNGKYVFQKSVQVEKEFNTFSLDVGFIAKGVYVLSLNDGEKVERLKLIIE